MESGLLVRSDSTASGATPDLYLRRTANATTGAENLGVILFQGLNNASPRENTTYANIICQQVTTTDGDEDGKVIHRVVKDGTMTTILEVEKTGIDVNGTINATSAVTVNGSAVALASAIPSVSGLASLASPTFSGTVTAPKLTSNQTTIVSSSGYSGTDMAGHMGKRIIHTGGVVTIAFPEVTASDVGKSWVIYNNGTSHINIERTGTLVFNTLQAGATSTDETSFDLHEGGAAEFIVQSANKILAIGSGF